MCVKYSETENKTLKMSFIFYLLQKKRFLWKVTNQELFFSFIIWEFIILKFLEIS